MRRNRSLTVVLLAIAMSALVGGLLGKSALATDDKVPEHYKAFTAALSAIEANYAGGVRPPVYGAIRDAGQRSIRIRAFSIRVNTRMRERAGRHYYGLGIAITSVDATSRR